jgi:FkbM family methyltransferase
MKLRILYIYIYNMNVIIISIIIIIILIIISLITIPKDKFDNYNNLSPPTKIINHPYYGIIKCFSNDLYVCETILNGNIWEENLFNNYFEPYIKEDTTIFDCGAYIGSHTISMKKLNRNNDIFVFEMMPEHYKIIQDNIKLNNFDNILTFNFALGDKIDKIKIEQVDYNGNNHNYGAIGINYNNGTDNSKLSNIDIPMIYLDYIMPFVKKPISFIKIDVEGNEISLLNGAKELITNYKPTICIEIWSNKYKEFINSTIWTFLQSLEYKIKNINGDDYLLYT